MAGDPETYGVAELSTKHVRARPLPRLSGSRQAIAGALVGRGWANGGCGVHGGSYKEISNLEMSQITTIKEYHTCSYQRKRQGECTACTGLWPFGLSQPGQRAAPLTLGVSHWSCGDSHCACGASHQCSGRGIRPLRRAAQRLPAFGASGPRTARRGTCTHARGDSLVLRGDPFALCPCPLAWLSQCIRTNDPFRGALPPVSDLPQ